MALVGNISGSGGTYSTVGITGSVIFAYTDTPSSFPTLPAVGGDVVFFVSGSTTGKNGTARNVAVFGGDTVVSGSLTIGSGSVKITSNDIQFSDAATRIERNGNNLKFFDASNTGGLTLTQLQGGGGSGGGFWAEDGLNEIYTTGSVAIGYAGAASDKGSDVFLYVSGANDGTKNALFDGDVVTSGSVTVRDGGSALSISDGGSASAIIRSISGDLLLDSTGGNFRVTVMKDLEIQGDDIVAGGTPTAKNIFTDIVSPAYPITIGGATTKTVVGGNLTVTGNEISGSAGGNLTLGSSGDVTVVGDLTVNGNDIKSSTGATAITLAGGNVIIPGDLTVNGTTVTVDATTLTIEDPVIGLGFTSGSTATTAGDRGFIGGMSTGGNVALFWDNTDSTFTSVRTSTGAGNDPVAITSYTPFRAASFEIGGTPGSAVTSNSAYVSSSDALNVLVNHKSSTTFTKSGTAIVQIADFSGEGMITGNSAVNTISTLWISGTTVNMGHTLAAAGGPVPHGIKIVGGTSEGGSLRISGSPGNTVFNINAHDGGNNAKSLVASGSAVTINAASSNANEGVAIQGAGTTLARFFGNASNTNINLLGTSDNLIDGTTAAGGGNKELSLSGSNINLKHGAGSGLITLQRVNSKYGSISYVTDGPSNYAQFANDTTLANAVRIGSTGKVNLSGSNVEVAAGNGMFFNTTTAASSVYLTIGSGSFALAGTSIANAAKVESVSGNPLLLGSAGAIYLTGSSARISVGGTNTVGFQRDGTGFIAFSSGSTSTNDVTVSTPSSTIVNLFNTTATTVNFAGAGTAISVGALGSGATYLKNSALFISGTTTVGNSILPAADMQYDLGAPGTRFRNMYTGDLHLRNERGNWTIIEEADYLSITNNKNGKRYKFVLQEI